MDCSIAIATYNGEKYIAEQLESIIGQSCKPDQIIISDDGSCDGTIDACTRVLQKSSIRYSILRNENHGVANNFYNAIRHCDGDVIFFCDQDDVWLSSKVKIVLNFFTAHPSCCMVVSNAIIWNPERADNTSSLFDFFNIGNVIGEDGIADSENLINKFIRHNFINGMCMAIRKSIVQFPDTNLHIYHDVWFTVIAIANGDIAFLSQPEAKYRQHADNTQGLKRNLKGLSAGKAVKGHKLALQKELEKYEIILSVDKNILSRSNFDLVQEKKKSILERIEAINNHNIIQLIKTDSEIPECEFKIKIINLFKDCVSAIQGGSL